MRAGEPSYLVEFGLTFEHAFMGFVRPFNNLGPGTGGISGTVSNSRAARSATALFNDGQPLPNCWIGLNGAGIGPGLYAAPCDEDSDGIGNSAFTISGVPPGSYQLVVWDRYLDVIIGFNTVIVGNGEAVNLGKVGVPMLVPRPAALRFQ